MSEKKPLTLEESQEVARRYNEQQKAFFLREQTGCGLMDCVKALRENDGDMVKAKAWLEERGDSLFRIVNRLHTGGYKHE